MYSVRKAVALYNPSKNLVKDIAAPGKDQIELAILTIREEYPEVDSYMLEDTKSTRDVIEFCSAAIQEALLIADLKESECFYEREEVKSN